MKKSRVDAAPLQGYRGAVAKSAISLAQPKGVTDSDATNCVYCRLALSEGTADAESWEASFDGLCAWHKARTLSGS